MGMFGGLAALPLYLQIVKGVSPTKAGLLLIPLTFGIMAGSIVSGQIISRTERYKKFPIIGSGLLVLALAGLGQIGVDTELWVTMSLAAVFGIGLGFNMQPLTLAVQNAVPPQDMGVATSSATFFRQMGGTLGTAVFLSVLFSTVGDKIAAAFRADAATPAFQAALTDPQVLSDPTNKRVVDAVTGGGGLPKGALDDTSFLSRLDDRLARPFLEGFTGSMDLVFTSAAAVVLVAFVVVFFLPEEKLRTMSGIEARRQDAADAAAAATVPGHDPASRAASVSAPSSQMVDGATLDEADLDEAGSSGEPEPRARGPPAQGSSALSGGRTRRSCRPPRVDAPVGRHLGHQGESPAALVGLLRVARGGELGRAVAHPDLQGVLRAVDGDHDGRSAVQDRVGHQLADHQHGVVEDRAVVLGTGGAAQELAGQRRSLPRDR